MKRNDTRFVRSMRPVKITNDRVITIRKRHKFVRAQLPMKLPRKTNKVVPGNKLALGHKPKPGDKKRGPKPNWYKEKCESYLRDGNLFNFFSRVAKGDRVDRVVTMGGDVIQIPASIRNRMAAICELRDTAFGKPSSSVDVTSGGKAISDLPSILAEARKRANEQR